MLSIHCSVPCMAPDAARHHLSSLDGCSSALFSVSHSEIPGRENSKDERQEMERRKENPEVGRLPPRDNGSAEIL